MLNISYDFADIRIFSLGGRIECCVADHKLQRIRTNTVHNINATSKYNMHNKLKGILKLYGVPLCTLHLLAACIGPCSGAHMLQLVRVL